MLSYYFQDIRSALPGLDLVSVTIERSEGRGVRPGARIGNDNTGSFSKVVLSQGAVKLVFFGVVLMFLAFLHSKIWA